MIKTIKPILFHQNTFYGGFVYSLANFLNNKYILSELSTYKNINITDYHRNKIYHKYTNQKTLATDSIQRKLNIPLYPFSIRNEKHKSLFEFDNYSLNKKGLYKVYIIHCNLTKIKKHDFFVLKPLDIAKKIIVIDPMQKDIIKMNSDTLFKEYYVIGFSLIENKKFNKVLFKEEEIKHLF